MTKLLASHGVSYRRHSMQQIVYSRGNLEMNSQRTDKFRVQCPNFDEIDYKS